LLLVLLFQSLELVHSVLQELVERGLFSASLADCLARILVLLVWRLDLLQTIVDVDYASFGAFWAICFLIVATIAFEAFAWLLGRRLT